MIDRRSIGDNGRCRLQCVAQYNGGHIESSFCSSEVECLL